MNNLVVEGLGVEWLLATRDGLSHRELEVLKLIAAGEPPVQAGKNLESCLIWAGRPM